MRDSPAVAPLSPEHFRNSVHRAFSRVQPPPPPQHVGAPVHTGEIVLMRRPSEWFDLRVQVRGIDRDLAVVLVGDRFEIIPLTWLRRSEIMR
jgi:hypothetical protein